MSEHQTVRPPLAPSGWWIDHPPNERRLTICMLAACPFPANHGTPGSIREMAEALAECGHAIHVVTYHMGENISVRGVQLHRIPALTRESAVVVGPTVRRPLYDLQIVFKALAVIRRYHPDLIHAHGYEAALAAWLCRLWTGLPFLYSGHMTMADELPSYRFIRPQWLAHGLARVLDAFVPPLADRCLPHSANMAQFFRCAGLGGRSETPVPFGINVAYMAEGDGARVRRRYGLVGCPVILYTGVLDEFQRLDLLLDALRVIVRDEPRAKLLVVTTIPHRKHEDQLMRQARELGVADHVVLTEPQPLDAVRDCLAAGDVAVVPRPREPGFPIKLLNYMAASRASVLFASSASTGLVDRHNALLAAPDTSQALGEAILELLRDDDLRGRLAANGHRFVWARHDRSVVARQVVEAYRRTLAGTGHARSCPPAPVRATVAAPRWGDREPAASGQELGPEEGPRQPVTPSTSDTGK